jgi:DNA-binding CsgD family transcriptional regulator
MLEAVTAASTPTAAWRALVAPLAPLFGSDILYLYGGQRRAAAPTLDPGQLVILGKMLDGWRRLYFSEASYRRHDPIRTWVRRSLEPLDWAQLKGRADVPALERRMWRDLEDIGPHGGLTFPIYEPATGHYGAVSIYCRSDLADFRALGRQCLGALHAAALHFHGCFRARFAAPCRSDIELSRREREVLLWVANGLVTKAIARRLNLSPYTVDVHIARAMKRLGARTRSEAASLAIRQGLIAA